MLRILTSAEGARQMSERCMSDRFWVGKRKDSAYLWVHDSIMFHDDPRMVYLFNTDSSVMKEYERDFARSLLATVRGADRDTAVAIYEKWYATNGEDFLHKDEPRRKKATEERNQRELIQEERRVARAEARQREAIEKHKQYLTRHKIEYKGAVIVASKAHRATHCYACKDELDSQLHIQCQSCGWLICYCGACGCGYDGHV